MLLSKLFKSIIAQPPKHTLRFLPLCHFASKSSSDGKGQRCSTTYDTIQPFSAKPCSKKSDCAEKKQLERRKQECQKCPKIPPGPCKDAPLNGPAVFNKALAEIRREALDLEMLTSTSANSLASAMLAEMSHQSLCEKSRIETSFAEIEAKVRDICQLSPTCGDTKRREGFKLALKYTKEFQRWESENVAGWQTLECNLDRLRCKIKERTDTAVEIVQTCRGCLSPQALVTCTQAAAKDAECILEITREFLNKEMRRWGEFKARCIAENTSELVKIMGNFDADTQGFSKELTKLACELKKKHRKC